MIRDVHEEISRVVSCKLTQLDDNMVMVGVQKTSLPFPQLSNRFGWNKSWRKQNHTTPFADKRAQFQFELLSQPQSLPIPGAREWTFKDLGWVQSMGRWPEDTRVASIAARIFPRCQMGSGALTLFLSLVCKLRKSLAASCVNRLQLCFHVGFHSFSSIFEERQSQQL